MSEQPAERAPRSSGGGGIKGTFTNKIGPLPMWVWLVILAAIIVGWSWYENRKSAASSTSTTAADSTSANDVPQFVNQTYVNTSPPMQPAPGPAGPAGPTGPAGTPAPAPKPGSQNLTRTWTSLGGSTYAQVAQRLLGNTDVGNLKPANAAATNWVDKTYAKNHNAKMPKGLQFTYQEGTVTTKS